MGVGFTRERSEYSGEARYANPGVSPVPKQDKRSPDVVAWIKGITAIVGTLVVLGGIIWGAANVMNGFASDGELDDVEDRVELIEKNDLVQTVILEQIRGTLEKIEQKLDKALDK